MKQKPKLPPGVSIRGQTYCILFYEGGKRFREAAGPVDGLTVRDVLAFRKKRRGEEAQRARGTLQEAPPKAKPAPPPQSPTVSAVLASYRERQEKRGCSARSLSNLRVYGRGIEAAIGKDRIAESIDFRDLVRIREGRSDVTAAKYVAHLQAVLRWARKNGKIGRHVFEVLTEDEREMIFEQGDDPEKGYAYTPEEFERVVTHLPEPFAKPARLAFLFGLRRAEVFGLLRREVQIPERQIVLDGKRTKSGKLRRLPLTEAVRELVTPLPFLPDALVFPNERGYRRDLDHFNADWDEAVKAAELPVKVNAAGIVQKPDFHSLRHARATILSEQGSTYEQIAEAMGWADKRMARRYGSHREAARLASVFFPNSQPQKQPHEKSVEASSSIDAR